MVLQIGRADTFVQIGKRSHSWATRVNWQFIRNSVICNGAALSRTTPVPVSGTEGEVYIHPTNDDIYVWVDEFHDGDSLIPAQWYVIKPSLGTKMYIADEEKWYFFNQMQAWQELWDPNKTHRAIPREFSWYNPFLIRPNKTLFSYVATQEWVIEAGAPGSGAHCEVAPTGGSVVFQIKARGPVVGTITFAAGATEGVVDIPNEVVVLPTIEENQYEQAHVFQVTSPGNTRSMEGLNVTICGKIRSID